MTTGCAVSKPYGNLFLRLLANSSDPPADQPEGTGCWPWTGSTYRGYGQFSQREPGRRSPASRLAHRGMEQLMRDAVAQAAADDAAPGPWHAGLGPPVTAPPLGPDDTVDHDCYFRRCINPDHWNVVTRAQNTSNMRRRPK